ncbi:MAG TPA: hypothetical protein VK494_04570 [Gemmatimonadaceae bacterium]|jgi:hypothetical protein|nr:hypothetical protein [Gemmatimonadaceae bacterium]
MADPSRYPDTEPHTTPRWVKVFAIMAVIVVLLFLVALFLPGSHGPGRHMRGARTPPVQQGVQP